MKARLTLLLLLLVGLPLSANAQSSTARAMQEQFNQMSNITGPGAAMGARRGVLSGGSISIRNRITQSGPVNLVSSQPISFNSGDGCGGIDLYAGSLSAVTGDQLKEVGRQIASQATTYAFHLALSSLCQQCQNVMQQVNDVLQEFNFQIQDTCTLAKGIVQLAPGDQEGDTERKEIAAGMQQLGRDTRDAFAAIGRPRAGAETPTERLQERGTEEEKAAVIPGNLLWRAMRTANVESWSAPGGDSTTFMEELLSLVGSIQICHAKDPNCQSTSDDLATTLTREVPALLTLEAFVEGSNPTGTASENAPAVTRSLVYSCRDTANCLNPESRAFEFKGMRTFVMEAFNGTGAAGQGGIIAKLNGTDATALTPFQNALMAYHNETAAFVSQAVRAQPDGTIAKQFVADFSRQIAAEFTHAFLTTMLDNLRSAVQVHINDAAKARQLEMIFNAQQRLNFEFQQVRMQPQVHSLMAQRHQDLLRLNDTQTFGSQRGEMPVGAGNLGERIR